MKINFNAIIFTLSGFFFFHLLLDFEYFSAILGGFLLFWKILKSKVADPRWQLFWHQDVIVTWYDVIIPRDIYQEIDFRILYIF